MGIRKALSDLHMLAGEMTAHWLTFSLSDKLLALAILPTIGPVYLLAVYKLMFFLEVWNWKKMSRLINEI